MKSHGRLILIPSPLSADFGTAHIPDANFRYIYPLRHFIVEEIRNARRFLRKAIQDFPIDDCQFYNLNEHTNIQDIPEMMQALLKGFDMGLISGAGLPCVADPGQSAVAYAHLQGIEVIPLTGPSSIMLSLMASGFNGQNFVFHGYLPQEKNLRELKLKEIEKASGQHNQTQIFIEAPYRNRQMLESILSSCNPLTRLCVALDLHSESQWIHSTQVKSWKHISKDLHKKPAVFLLYSGSEIL